MIFSSCTSPSKRAENLCIEVYSQYWGANWDKVIELTTEAIETDPNFPWSYSLRGIAYTVTGKHDLAINDLNTAIRLDPLFEAAYTNRAILLMKIGKFDDAESDIIMALRLRPNEVISIITMAELQWYKNNTKESCVWLEKAVDIGLQDVINQVQFSGTFDNIQYLPCYEDLVYDQ